MKRKKYENIAISIPKVVENDKKSTNKRKSSFFDYFDKKDYDSVLKIIEEYKKENHNYYKVLVKEYGEHYNCLVVPSRLTKQEKIQLNSFRTSIRNRIKKDNFLIKPRLNKAQSFFDYFDKKDYDSVLKIIEEYKKLNHDYYKVLVKEYGEHYNCLVVPSCLTKKEKKQLNNFRNNIRNRIKNGNFLKKPKPTKKQSFFDYFDKKDYKLVLQLIEEYKKENHNYYKVLVKEYGERYDCLVVPSRLTKEEKVKLKKFRASIRNRIKNGNFLKKPKLIKKQSFFDYFDKKDYDSVLKIIEEYKEEDSEQYKILIKEYGTTYDCLVVPSRLTKEEKVKLNNFRANIRNRIKKGDVIKKTGPNKKQSFFDYFDEQDKNFILKIIEKYKEKDSNYYKLLVKRYGETYDCLVVPSLLTKKEKIQLNSFKMAIKKELRGVKSLKNQTSQNEDFNYDLSMSYIYRRFPNLKQEKDADLIILTSFIDKKKSVELISNLTKFSMKKIDFILLKHLYVFSFKMPVIIDEILRRGNYTISQIANFNYIQTQVPFLNDKEKELLYLKMTDLYQNQLSNVLEEIKDKIEASQNEDFNYDFSMGYIYRRFPNLKQEKDADLIILTNFIDKKKSVESISNLTKISIKKIDFILLKYLYVFSFKMSVIIDEILRRGNYTISQLVNFNYIQTYAPFLNDKEKELIYLKIADLYQNQLSNIMEFSDKEMKHKIKTLKFKDFN